MAKKAAGRVEKVYETVATFPSKTKSREGKIYTVKRDSEGVLSCDCPAWIYNSKGRVCLHTKMVGAGGGAGKVGGDGGTGVEATDSLEEALPPLVPPRSFISSGRLGMPRAAMATGFLDDSITPADPEMYARQCAERERRALERERGRLEGEKRLEMEKKRRAEEARRERPRRVRV